MAKAAPSYGVAAAPPVPTLVPPKQAQEQGAVEPEDAAPVPVAPPAAKVHERNVAKAAQRYRTQQRAANDKEIERIKQQAADELKKKTENQRLNAEARTDEASQRPRPAKPASKLAMLARCERASNFIRREQCKWEVCNGMWGKNGCPSYEKQATY
jgi:hypothetical protein